jgi:cytochrome c-type biogenesis protein CcmH
MTLFIACAAALLAAAVWLLTRAAWRRRGRAPADGSAAIVAALTGQLRQLAALRDAGALSPEHYETSKAALERKLLDLITSPAPAPAAAGPAAVDPAVPSRRLVVALAAFMAIVTAGGYWAIGSPGSLSSEPSASTNADAAPPPADAAASAPSHSMDSGKIEAMVDQLAARLKTNPDDAESWAMLARSQVVLERYEPALKSFAQAVKLRPDDAGLLADEADALAMSHGRSLQGEPTALIQRALKLDPNNVKALALAGTAAFDRKEYPEALRHWEALERAAPADSPIAVQVRAAIDEARRLAGLPPAPGVAAAASAALPATGTVPPTFAMPASSPATRTAAPGADAISGTLALAPALKARVSPDDSVFIFARAVDGPRMPLAVMRKQVKDLPMPFTLDDRMAMSPQMKLSGSRQVVLVARVSRSGNPIAQPGDLQGTSGPVAVGATGLRLEINQEVSGAESASKPK